jgi:hypothetical protein
VSPAAAQERGFGIGIQQFGDDLLQVLLFALPKS